MTPRTFLLLLQMPIVAFLAISSLQAQRAFRQRGFLFVALGWTANLCYLLANHEASFLPQPQAPFLLKLGRAADLLDIATATFFWLAYEHARPQRAAPARRVTVAACFVVIFAYELLIFFHVIPTPGPRGAMPQIAASVFGIGCLAAFYALLRPRERWRDRALLWAGLSAYIAIQPLYLVAFAWPAAMEWGFILGMVAKICIAFGIVGYLVAAAAEGVLAEAQETRLRDLTGTVGRILHEIGTPVFQIGVHSSQLAEVAPRGAFRSHIQSLENARLRLTATLEASRQLLPFPDKLINLRDHANTFHGIPRFAEVQVVSANTLVELALMAVKETRNEIVKVYTDYSANCCLRCKPIEITQAVINLVRNAYDSLPDGTGVLHITTRTDEVSGKPVIAISVEDDGEGIPRERQTAVMVQGVTTRGGIGRGYGLAVVKDVADLNDGSILLTSPVNSDNALRPGTKIVLMFPRVPCEKTLRKANR
jgi:signal transduction histidine kinase